MALRRGLYHTAGAELAGRELIGTRAPALPATGRDAGFPPPTQGKVLPVRFRTPGWDCCGPTWPALEDLWKRQRDRGLGVVGLERRTPDAQARVTFPCARDPGGKLLDECWTRGQRPAACASFLIDRRGVIRFLHRGGEFHPSRSGEHEGCATSFALIEEWAQRLLAE